ncbi:MULTISPECIES: adenylosuccinate synthase [unclassified Methylophilus]|jgi:adenylosuccinate synthase|uniref:adenylosuccinate synthase n=1 Tax=unclassified Methylophilus TaxID=2630143 RepID=UPI0006F8566B|nr:MULTISPECIES: adenylosuccinate synthase [unclassified Methylophilus]KQT43356.1 adenylosuccinate synthetase [Methylophilus sp. Leaf416]KQT58841.1 adenylosuccinate synthetase [Methylophilus sp. Leaf459]
MTQSRQAKNVVVIGTQWGDEGKGKIVDWLTDHAQGVVRFQGGHNAGHTLVVGQGDAQKVYKLNLVPSGIVREGVNCYIGNGVVLDTTHLLHEIATLEQGGLDVKSRLKVSPGCPLILSHHVAVDLAREAKRSADKKIGTTGKGIGPAYEDKVARRALRVYDLFHPERFAEKLREVMDYHNFVLTKYLGAAAVDFQQQYDASMQHASVLKPMVADVSAALYEANARGEHLLFEGAQGTLLDIDHGTYPYVTSSNCIAGQASAGTGVGANMLHYVLGITKAYTTRVGGGPFPSELDIETEGVPGYQMSTVGQEIGTVTRRKRRCGWFDAAALRRSARINGLTGLCITKLDVLDGIESLDICTGYTLDGKVVDMLPVGADDVAGCVPIYETVPGWTETTFGVKTWEGLPKNAQHYLKRLEALCGVPIAIVSTGPERDETIVLQHPFA